MTLRSTSVNLGNPGEIGGTSPGAITGTTITANTKFVATTGTVTADTPTYSATQTWNNGAVAFTGYKINITDAASAAGSLLLDLQVGGVSKDKTDKSGNKTLAGRIITSDGTPSAPTYSFATDNNYGLSFFAGNQIAVSLAGERKMRFLQGGGLAMASDMRFAWSGTTDASASADDLMLYRDAANTLALRNGTAAQTRRVYNTFTDASNYERLSEIWSSNVCYHKTEAAGTGTLRQYIPVTNGVAVASLPLAATAGTGARSFVTDANATTFASVVAGGGANKVPVYSDGTDWRIG